MSNSSLHGPTATISSESFAANAIIDMDGDINIRLAPSTTLYFGIVEQSIEQRTAQQSLAMILDPTDLSAMIEHSVNLSSHSPFTADNRETLNIDDVLHREDTLDIYLPPDTDTKWYLGGDGRAIDAGITSAGMQDIYDALLSQQLLSQQYSE